MSIENSPESNSASQARPLLPHTEVKPRAFDFDAMNAALEDRYTESAYDESFISEPENIPDIMSTPEDIALGGVASVIKERLTGVIDRRARLEGRIERISLSLDRHSETADVFMNPEADDITKKSKQGVFYRKLDDQGKPLLKPIAEQLPDTFSYGSVDSRNMPKNISQRRQAWRASRRKTRADNLRTGEQYRLRTGWGSDIGNFDEEGNSVFVNRLRRDLKDKNISIAEYIRGVRAHRKYMSYESKVTNYDRRVRRSSRSRDIPGKTLNLRLRYNQRKLEALDERGGKTWLGAKKDDYVRKVKNSYEEGLTGTRPIDNPVQRAIDKMARTSGRDFERGRRARRRKS